MKNFLRELILPSFWLTIFIATSSKDVKVDKIKKVENIIPIVTGLKKDITVSGKVNTIEKNNESKFINPIYLTGF